MDFILEIRKQNGDIEMEIWKQNGDIEMEILKQEILPLNQLFVLTARDKSSVFECNLLYLPKKVKQIEYFFLKCTLSKYS